MPEITNQDPKILHVVNLSEVPLNQFSEEEVGSSFVYPEEYLGPKAIHVQIEEIARIFDLDPRQALKYAKHLPPLESFVPADTLKWTGFFAVPSDSGLQKLFPELPDPGERYCAGVRLDHTKIAESRPFYNYRGGQMLPQYLRVSTRTAHAQSFIAVKQPGDIWVIAAQLGILHRGRSVRRAHAVFAANEFGLTSFMVGSILLTHPKRLMRGDELCIDCAGDEFAPDADGDFSNAPFFHFGDGEVEFGADWYGQDGEYYGSASAFLSQ